MIRVSAYQCSYAGPALKYQCPPRKRKKKKTETKSINAVL
jgi:hypothetical protein